jgi:hypothetical protein
MDGARLKKALDAALAELEETERRIRSLCEEYRSTVRIAWLCLYCQEGRPGKHVQGPFWARLRRAKVRGQTRVIKEYLGRKLSRLDMYKLGVLEQAEVLKDYDRRAKLLRDRKTKLLRALESVRKLVGRYAD